MHYNINPNSVLFYELKYLPSLQHSTYLLCFLSLPFAETLAKLV